MSTDMSQVGVTLFPSFQHFFSFHLSRFSFYINIDLRDIIHKHCMLAELEREKPRGYRVHQMPTRGETLKYLTRSLWLNNNGLTSVAGLDKLVTKTLQQPSALAWIDLSFNNLLDVPDVSTLRIF